MARSRRGPTKRGAGRTHLALGAVLPLDVADQCIILGARHILWACGRAHELVENGTTIEDTRSGQLLERRSVRSLELGLSRERDSNIGSAVTKGAGHTGVESLQRSH